MRKRHLLGFICYLFLFLPTIPAGATTFTDNFDNQYFTNSNWQIVAPEWSFLEINDSTATADYGFRGEYTITPGVDGNAIALADNGSQFDYFNIAISTELSILQREIYENSGDLTPKDEGGTIAFYDTGVGESVFASLFYSYTEGWIHGAGIGTNDGDQIENSIFGIDYDRFYYLDLIVDLNGIITSNLRDDTGLIISTITEYSAPILSNGVVAIISDADTVFNNFTVTNPVPEPSTMLLLGTGLLGLAGASRKKFSKK